MALIVVNYNIHYNVQLMQAKHINHLQIIFHFISFLFCFSLYVRKIRLPSVGNLKTAVLISINIVYGKGEEILRNKLINSITKKVIIRSCYYSKLTLISLRLKTLIILSLLSLLIFETISYSKRNTLRKLRKLRKRFVKF